jgi:hypothetical protein
MDMPHSISLTLRSVVAISALTLSMSVRAAVEDSAVAAMRYVSLDVQSDNADATQFSGTGSFTLGKHTWLHGTLGRITDSNSTTLGDLQHYGLGAGFRAEHLQVSLDFSHYKNDESYKQRDILASLDWLTERFSMGLDVFRRDTDNSIDSVRDFPALNLTNVTLHADEQLTGNGIGLHADFYLTNRLNLSLGGMSYNYDSDYTLSSSSNPLLLRRLLAKHPTISKLVYLNNSGVTRSLALLDNSYNLGLSYQFGSMALAAQYLRDQALETDDVTHTAILSATVFVGDRWMPGALGRPVAQHSADDVASGLSSATTGNRPAAGAIRRVIRAAYLRKLSAFSRG